MARQSTREGSCYRQPFDQIKRQWTLHLSGTPFKALASGKFDQDQVFNWTYEDERVARQHWGCGFVIGRGRVVVSGRVQ